MYKYNRKSEVDNQVLVDAKRIQQFNNDVHGN